MGEFGQPRPGGGVRDRLRAWRARLRGDRQRRLAREAAAARLYAAAVGLARERRWFAELGVPDTPEGRFEMIALHIALLLRRLRREGPAGGALGQALFDRVFAEVDVALRELGVGDLGVGRQVKRLAGQFYARLATLDRALGEAAAGAQAPEDRAAGAPAQEGHAAAGGARGEQAREDPAPKDEGLGERAHGAGPLGAALAPVWQGGPPPAPGQVAALAAHLLALEQRLGALPGGALLRGEADLAPAAYGGRAGLADAAK